MYLNPKVSLRLDRVSCAEAMAALGEAAGIRLELPSEEKLAKAPELRSALGDLEEPNSFDWTRCTFAQALRELCHSYGLTPAQYVDGHYTLFPHLDAPSPGDPPAIADYQSAGIRVFPTAITLSRTWHLNFIHTLEGSVPSRRQGDRNDLSVHIACQIAEGDPGRLAGVRNWLAEDDQGHTFRSLVEEAFAELDLHHGGLGPYPDEWNESTLFPPPSGGATQLRRLEGDLLSFETYRYERLEFPLPLPANARVQERLGDVTLEVRSFEPGPQCDSADTPADKMEHRAGPLIKARIHKPKGVYVSSPGEIAQVRPVLLGRGGHRYEYDLMAGDGRGRARDEVVKVVARYAANDDPPATIVFELAIKANPQPLLIFSLRDIPLPGDA